MKKEFDPPTMTTNDSNYRVIIPQDQVPFIFHYISVIGETAANICRGNDAILESNVELLVAARFFDAYSGVTNDTTIKKYSVLMGSAAYYLCGQRVTAAKLAEKIDNNDLNLDGEGLENLLLWLLRFDLDEPIKKIEGIFKKFIYDILLEFWEYADFDKKTRVDIAMKMRELAYKSGTHRQILFADIITAIIKIKPA